MMIEMADCCQIIAYYLLKFSPPSFYLVHMKQMESLNQNPKGDDWQMKIIPYPELINADSLSLQILSSS